MSLLFASGDPASGRTVIIEQAAAAGSWSDGGNIRNNDRHHVVQFFLP